MWRIPLHLNTLALLNDLDPQRMIMRCWELRLNLNHSSCVTIRPSHCYIQRTHKMWIEHQSWTLSLTSNKVSYNFATLGFEDSLLLTVTVWLIHTWWIPFSILIPLPWILIISQGVSITNLLSMFLISHYSWHYTFLWGDSCCDWCTCPLCLENWFFFSYLEVEIL